MHDQIIRDGLEILGWHFGTINPPQEQYTTIYYIYQFSKKDSYCPSLENVLKSFGKK